MARFTRWDRLLTLGMLVAIAAVVVLSSLMAANVAAGHANFHAFLALVGAIPAGILAWRPEPARWRSIAIVGLELLAITQLVEGIGAWGFGPDNDTVVSPIKGLHDLGVAISPIGLVGAVVGVAVGIALALRARGQSALAIAAAGGLGVVGLVVVAKVVGM